MPRPARFVVGEVRVGASATSAVRVDVVAFDEVIVDTVMVGEVIVCEVAFAVVVIGEVIVCTVAFDMVAIDVVAIGMGAIGVEVGIEAETGVGSSLFALVDAAPVVMPLISFLICWMMHLTMSHCAMVLGEAR